MSESLSKETTINNARIIQRDVSCYRKIQEALDFLSVVTRTLGPGGLPIFIERKKLPPLTTKDGVTVAKQVYHPDRAINTIIQSIKEASIKTNEEAGDGTTTAIVLTNAIFKEAMKLVESGLCTPNDLVNEMTLAEKLILESLESQSRKINDDKEKLLAVANISCNGDESISQMVVKAIEAVGEDGVIAVDEGTSSEATLRIEEGYELKKGLDHWGPYASHLMTNKLGQESILQNAKLLFYAGEISDINKLVSAFQNIGVEKGSERVEMPPLAIVAYDVKGPALDMLMQNRIQAGLELLPIMVASQGPRSQEWMIEDLAVLSGGTVIDPSKRSLASATKEDLGSAEKIISGMKRTRIFNMVGDEAKVFDRVTILKKQLDEAEFQYDKDNIKERLGKLSGGIAVIGIGGNSDLERKERKARVEDAINATRDALEEGVVPGGGVALLRAGQRLKDGYGAKVFNLALQYPFKQVLTNCSDPVDFFLSKILSEEYEVYNCRDKKLYKDFLMSGVLDPLKVVKSAFSNACSIAKELIKAGGIMSYAIQPKLDDEMYNTDE